MYFFPNIKTTPFSPQLMRLLGNVYENKGKETFYLSLIKNDSKVIKQSVIETDAEFAGRLLHIDISNQKYRLITQEGITPNNRKEKLVANLVKFFQIMHKAESNWKLSVNGIIEIQEFIFKEFDPNSSIDKKRNRLEKRTELENLVMHFNRLLSEGECELFTLFCAFVIDFINLRTFDENNEFIGILLLMLLLKQHGYKVVDHISTLKILFEQEQALFEAINKSSLNWSIGLPQYHYFTMFMINTLNQMYIQFDKLCSNFQVDKQYSKEELVEQIISSLGTYFTKDDIRKNNPYISDSTINRTLKSLRERNIIEPTGKGRSAKWRKVKHSRYQEF